MRFLGVVRPHGIKHTATTEAIRCAREAGYGVEEVLDLTGHAGIQVLMSHNDRERNVQGELSSLLAASAMAEGDGADGVAGDG